MVKLILSIIYSILFLAITAYGMIEIVVFHHARDGIIIILISRVASFVQDIHEILADIHEDIRKEREQYNDF